MNVPNRDEQILQHIIRYCNQIETTLTFFKATKQDFERSFLIQNSISMPVQQIGELTKRFTDEFRNKNNIIPWKAIAGMRDYLAHEYMEMDTDITWDTISKDIPQLKKYCIKLLKKNDIPIPTPEKTFIKHLNQKVL